MATDNTIERILSRLTDADDGVAEKTAAVAAPSTEARMLDTVRRISTAAVTKTASAAQAAAPASDLQTIAKEAAAAEEAALEAQTKRLGAVFADSFMERYAQYDAALSAAGVKTAAVNPELVKQAAEDGYRRAVADMEKRAEEEYQRGYQDQLKAIHKTASEIHYAGQSMAHAVIDRIAAGAR